MAIGATDHRPMLNQPLDAALMMAQSLMVRLDEAPAEESAREIESLVDVVRSFAPRDADPFTMQYLNAGALEAETALSGRSSSPPASARLGVETIRQALLRVQEGRETSDDRPLGDVVQWLVERLHVTPARLAELLDVAPGTVRRWLAEDRVGLPESEEMQRARVLAQVVASLRHALTARGTMSWLDTPHPALKGRRPAQLLSEADAVADLVSLAAQGRSQTAS